MQCGTHGTLGSACTDAAARALARSTIAAGHRAAARLERRRDAADILGQQLRHHLI